jgi:LysM repeat protein
MNYNTANRLIIILTAAIVVSALYLAILWRQPNPPEIAPLPTMAAIVDSPSPSATPAPRPSATPSPPPVNPTETPAAQVALPTATAVAAAAEISHTVQPGDTLTTIAAKYNVSIAAIVTANSLPNPDTIYPGQTLRIPVNTLPQSASRPTTQPTSGPISQPTAVLAATPITVTQSTWPPSLTGDDVTANYPLNRLTTSGRMTVHYQPGTYPEREINTLVQSIDAIWTDIESQLGKPFPQTIDVYLAGTLFAVNPALQGLTQSWQYRSFILVNGAFHPGEAQYIIAHELTHVAASHLLGPASSTMIHEGLAVHLPQAYLTQQAGYLPHTEICAAILGTPEFKTAVQMHTFGYNPSGFGGHIRNFFHYNLSGCFVTYLLETYGLEKFDAVYDSGDYEGVYGLTLGDLDQAWQAWLTAVPVTVDSQQLINSVNNVATAYEGYFAASAGGKHADWNAYLYLNRARLAANRGQFIQAAETLDDFYAIFTAGS